MNKHLYNNLNPNTTIKGFGYRNKEKALNTIKILNKSGRNIEYKFQVVNTMLNRAKYHKSKTTDMDEAIKVFEQWIQNYKKIPKNIVDKYPFLNLSLITKYEKIAEIYNVSLVSRGLKKSSQSDYGFLIIYKNVKGNFNKLKNIYIRKNSNISWFDKRNNQVKAKYLQAKKGKIDFFYKNGKFKDLPTPIHINMIMLVFSPYPDILYEREKLLKNLK
jgi:hypothetical protein